MFYDIKNVYLGTPMERYEYIYLPLNTITEKIIEQYNLRAMKKMDISMLTQEKKCVAPYRKYE